MITNRTIWLVWVEPTDDDLLKGLSHKYLKRLPTGKQRPKWRYIYQLPKTKGLTASDDLVAGAKFKGIHRGQEGHYEVLEHLKDKGLVHVRHDESGKEAHFKEHDLHAAIKAYHDKRASKKIDEGEKDKAAEPRKKKKTKKSKPAEVKPQWGQTKPDGEKKEGAQEPPKKEKKKAPDKPADKKEGAAPDKPQGEKPTAPEEKKPPIEPPREKVKNIGPMEAVSMDQLGSGKYQHVLGWVPDAHAALALGGLHESNHDKIAVVATAGGGFLLVGKAKSTPVINGVATGAPTKIVVRGGSSEGIQEMSAEYAVVEADQLIASHNPENFEQRADYPEGVQERRYHDIGGEQGKIVRIATSMQPQLVVNTNPDCVNGAPIVTENNVVLGGNGRTMGQQLAYSQYPKSAEALKSYLAANAHQFGINADAVSGMKKPILVRKIQAGTDPDKLRTLGRRMNESLTQGLDPRTAEVAIGKNYVTPELVNALASQMDPENTLSEFLSSSGSRDFLKTLENAGVIDDVNRDEFMDGETGLLNEDGRLRVERVLAARVLPDAAMLQRMPTDTRQNIAKSVPYLLRAESAGWDLRGPLMAAIKADMDFRASSEFKTHDAYMNQVVSRELAPSHPMHAINDDPLAKLLFQVVREHNGPRKMPAGFREFARRAEDAKKSGGTANLFGEVADTPTEAMDKSFGIKPETKRLIAQAAKETADEMEKLAQAHGVTFQKTKKKKEAAPAQEAEQQTLGAPAAEPAPKPEGEATRLASSTHENFFKAEPEDKDKGPEGYPHAMRLIYGELGHIGQGANHIAMAAGKSSTEPERIKIYRHLIDILVFAARRDDKLREEIRGGLPRRVIDEAISTIFATYKPREEKPMNKRTELTERGKQLFKAMLDGMNKSGGKGSGLKNAGRYRPLAATAGAKKKPKKEQLPEAADRVPLKMSKAIGDEWEKARKPIKGQMGLFGEGGSAPASAPSRASGSKPPPGYVAISNSQHGGYYKQMGSKRVYWYPDDQHLGSASHHADKAQTHRDKADIHGNRAAVNPLEYTSQQHKAANKAHAEAAEHYEAASMFADRGADRKSMAHQMGEAEYHAAKAEAASEKANKPAPAMVPAIKAKMEHHEAEAKRHREAEKEHDRSAGRDKGGKLHYEAARSHQHAANEHDMAVGDLRDALDGKEKLHKEDYTDLAHKASAVADADSNKAYNFAAGDKLAAEHEARAEEHRNKANQHKKAARQAEPGSVEEWAHNVAFDKHGHATNLHIDAAKGKINPSVAHEASRLAEAASVKTHAASKEPTISTPEALGQLVYHHEMAKFHAGKGNKEAAAAHEKARGVAADPRNDHYHIMGALADANAADVRAGLKGDELDNAQIDAHKTALRYHKNSDGDEHKIQAGTHEREIARLEQSKETRAKTQAWAEKEKEKAQAEAKAAEVAHNEGRIIARGHIRAHGSAGAAAHLYRVQKDLEFAGTPSEHLKRGYQAEIEEHLANIPKEERAKAETRYNTVKEHYMQHAAHLTEAEKAEKAGNAKAAAAHKDAANAHKDAAEYHVYGGMADNLTRMSLRANLKSGEATAASSPTPELAKAPEAKPAEEKPDRKPRSKWGAAEKTAAAEEHKHKAAEHDAAAEALPGGIGGGKETHQHAAILHRQAAEAAKGAKKDYRRAADQAERSSEFAHGMHPIKKSLYGLDAATIRHHGALPFALGAPVRDNMNKSRDSRTLPELAPCTEENMKKSKAAPSLQQTIRDFGPLPFPIDEAAVIKMREYEVQPVITPHTFSENIPADIIDGVADLGPKSGAGGQAGEDDENDRSQIFAEPEVVIVQNTPGAQRGPFGSSY